MEVMISLIGNFTALALYTFASAYLVLQFNRQAIPHRPLLVGMAIGSLCFHGLGIYGLNFSADGLHLGLFRVPSMIFWVINLIVLLSSLKKPLHNLFILLFPLSALTVILSLVGQEGGDQVALGFGMASHVLLSIVAYSLLTIATLQALLLAWQNRQLKHKHTTGSVRLLPPLQTMESLLFELLWAGQVLLTLSILSGVFFLEDIFAQHLAHKTAFSIAAWLIYALLLWGRHQLGWRGYTAIRWTLAGFALLMLAYFGSKLVLEVILS